MDYISRLRDYQILSVYSADIGLKKQDVFSSFYVDSFREYKEFYQCYKSGKINCSSILAEGEVIPSFEDYAKEIDIFIEAGYEPSCFGGFDSRSEENPINPEIDGSE